MTRPRQSVYIFTKEGIKALREYVEARMAVIGNPPDGEPTRSHDSRRRLVELRSAYSRAGWNDALGPIPNQWNGSHKIKAGQLEDMAAALEVPLADLLAAGNASGPLVVSAAPAERAVSQ